MVFTHDQLDWEAMMLITEPTAIVDCDLPKKKKKNRKPVFRSDRIKTVLAFDQLDIRSQHIYRIIRSNCPTYPHLQEILNSAPTRQVTNGCSGRTIDYLVTHFTTLMTPGYYLDISEPRSPSFVGRDGILNPNRTYTYVDIGHAYKQNMGIYSKCFFDCFKRGKPVLYCTDSGDSVELFLGQVMFFIWVCKFKVLDFLVTIRPKLIEAKKYIISGTDGPVKVVKYITWVIYNPPVDLGKVS
jgi:hypothetical protein